jgi:hypothetical protein
VTAVIQKLRILFSDFLRALRRLWLEFIGGMFLALGIVFILSAVQEYRRYLRAPGLGAGRLVMVLVPSGVMIFFALESFWKSRKSR